LPELVSANNEDEKEKVVYELIQFLEKLFSNLEILEVDESEYKQGSTETEIKKFEKL
jgi:hypothetical protein